MFEFVKAGGIMMWPIILCSIAMFAIVVEKFISLQTKKVSPQNLLPDIWRAINENAINMQYLKNLRENSPLGLVLATGLSNAKQGREIMKERIEEVAAWTISKLEKYLNALGTIAGIAPLLGLLGTVLGMIDIFAAFNAGSSSPQMLAAGISKALITTAAGLFVGIPALFFHRFFTRKVNDLVVAMEQDAIKLVEMIQNKGV